MSSASGDPLQDTAAILHQKLVDRRRAIGSLSNTAELPPLDEGGSLQDTSLGSPLRLSQLQPRSAPLGDTPSTISSSTSQATNFVSLRERMASAKRQLPPLSTASPIATVQATDAERQPATQLNESIRDRLRAQVTAARIKKQQSLETVVPPGDNRTQLEQSSSKPRKRDTSPVKQKWKKAVDFAGVEADREHDIAQSDAMDFFIGRFNCPPTDADLNWRRKSSKVSDRGAKPVQNEMSGQSGTQQSDGAREVHIDMPNMDAADEDEPMDELETSALLDGNERRRQRRLESRLKSPGEELQLLMPGHATVMSKKQLFALEDQLYFLPSTVDVPVEDKLPEGCTPRFLDQEGIFTGRKLQVSDKNQAIIENRLLRQQSRAKEWFGADGRLISFPDPLKPRPDRKVEWWLEEEEGAKKTSVYFHPAQLDPDTRLNELHTKHWRLSINIEFLNFTHHHLFGVEHVLASRLLQYYDAYKLRKLKGHVQYFTDKLKVLKLAAAQLQTTLAMGRDGSEEKMRQLTSYRQEIRRVRQLRDLETLTEKQLLKNMFSCWMQIKGQRQLQGYTSTGLKLSLKKDVVDKETDEQKWLEDVEEEVLELRQDAEEDYQARLAVYKHQKAIYKASLQQAATAAASPEGASQAPAAQAADIPRPRKPPPFDENACRAAVSERAMVNRRRPGNPIITPTLDKGLPVTAITDCPRDEQVRRRDVMRQHYFVRMMIDGREVVQSKSKMLEQDFTISFNETISTHPVRWPTEIRLQVVEDNHLQSRLLSEVFVAVPHRQIAIGDAGVQNLEFTSQRRVASSVLSAVGSGSVSVPPPKVDGVEDHLQRTQQEILTAANMAISCGWNIDPVSGKPAAPPNFDEDTDKERTLQSGDAIGALGMAGVADVQKLATWLEQAQLDPNDPKNFDLLQSVQDFKARQHATIKSFRLSSSEKSTYFATDEDLESDRRMRLIKIRNDQETKYSQGGRKNIKIPATAIQVTGAMLQDAVRPKEERPPDADDLDDISARRTRGRQFLEDARKRVSERAQTLESFIRKEYVINEDPMPDVGAFFLSVLRLLNPFTSSKDNQDRLAERGTTGGAPGGGVSVRLQIVSANRLPKRVDISHSVSQPGRRVTPPTLRPFVEVSFQRNKERTDVAEGTDPDWNESLTLPLVSNDDDYTANGLQRINDIIYFNVFDEELVDLIKDESKRETNIHQRRQRHWLGSFCLPFQTLYASSQVSGTFLLKVPLVLLCYQPFQVEASIVPWWLQRGGQRYDGPCLTINVTLEPRLAPLPTIQLEFDSREEPRLLKAALQWQNLLMSKFPKRSNRVTVVNFQGSTVFITRYIAKQCPPIQVCPQHNLSSINMKQLERAAHFVALIPFVSDTAVFAGTCDLWATSEEFLQMLCGDEEEHAVLLCNYFLFMKQRAWVVIGSAIPEGDTAYVLVESPSSRGQPEYQLWNPSSGQHFSPFNPLCPLQEIFFLFNDVNVWANIQPEAHPLHISFDLSNASKWRPFFSPSFPALDLPSVQSLQLSYDTTPDEFHQRLEVVLEQRLMNEFMGWRERQVTRWNRHCSRALKELLPRFEANPFDVPISSTSPSLSNLLKSYRLTGFPLHMPYTDARAVVEALHSTGLHLNDDPTVEFALAVYTHVYPNEVVSLWLYVASVYKR